MAQNLPREHRGHRNMKEVPFKVIPREEMEDIYSPVHAASKDAITLKAFNDHKSISRFCSKNIGQLSMKWLHLKPGQEVKIHDHPVDTLMIVTRGQGALIGDLEQKIFEGDSVLIPSSKKHGVITTDDKGLWALSFRFNE